MKKKIPLFFFHEKYMLSPGQIAFFVKKYSKEQVIAVSDGMISLTTSGREWVLNNTAKVFYRKSTPKWKKVPLEFKGPFTLKINEPYLSWLSYSDMDSFLEYKKNLEEE